MQLVQQLKDMGYSVHVTHLRTFELPSIGKFWGTRKDHPAVPPLPQGGATIVTLYDAEGKYVMQSKASCSMQDNFSRTRGLMIAAGRAICELSGEAQRRREARNAQNN